MVTKTCASRACPQPTSQRAAYSRYWYCWVISFTSPPCVFQVVMQQSSCKLRLCKTITDATLVASSGLHFKLAGFCHMIALTQETDCRSPSHGYLTTNVYVALSVSCLACKLFHLRNLKMRRRLEFIVILCRLSWL